MTPSILQKIANAALQFKDTYSEGTELVAYRQLSHALDEIRTHTSVKISAWSDGYDRASDGYRIVVRAFGDNELEKEIGHGYSAQGLYRAVLNAKWLRNMGIYHHVQITLTFHGDETLLPHADQEIAHTLAATNGELSDLAAWCREYMMEWE